MIPRSTQTPPSVRQSSRQDQMAYSKRGDQCYSDHLQVGDIELHRRERARMESATGGRLTWRFDGLKAELVEVAR